MDENIEQLISQDFVAGVVSVSGSFLYRTNGSGIQFCFQIKMPETNRALLELIRQALSLKNPVLTLVDGNYKYAMIITRSKKEIATRVVPYLKNRIFGQKLIQFQDFETKLGQTSIDK